MDNREVEWIAEEASVVGQLQGKRNGGKDQETTSVKGNTISKP